MTYEIYGVNRMSDIAKFRKILENLMEEKNINQITLANLAKLSPSTITRCFTGKKFPDVETLLKISRIFNVSISYLIGETDVRNADDTAIGLKFDIDDNVIENLKEIKKTNEKFENKYNDILGELLTNPDLYKDIVKNIDDTLKYKKDGSFRKEIDEKMRIKYFKTLSFEELRKSEATGTFIYTYKEYVEKKEREFGIPKLSKRDIEFKIRRLRSKIYELEKIKNKP